MGGTLGEKEAVDELLCREILSEPLVYQWDVVDPGIPEKRSQARIGLGSEVTALTATPSDTGRDSRFPTRGQGVQANFNFPRITDSFFFFFHLFVD